MDKPVEGIGEYNKKRMRTMREAEKVGGKAVQEWTLSPGEGLGFTVVKGQAIRVVDLEGQQVLDFVCFNSQNKEEKLWVGSTLNGNGSIYVTKGHSLYSQCFNKMFTIIEDTCGVHDLLCGACSSFVYEKYYGIKGHPNCMDNFAKALEPYRIERREIPMNFNIFMNCPVSENGSYKIESSRSQRGDFIDLKAEMDCIVAVSCCPSSEGPCNGYYPTPLKIILYEPTT